MCLWLGEKPARVTIVKLPCRQRCQTGDLFNQLRYNDLMMAPTQEDGTLMAPKETRCFSHFNHYGPCLLSSSRRFVKNVSHAFASLPGSVPSLIFSAV